MSDDGGQMSDDDGQMSDDDGQMSDDEDSSPVYFQYFLYFFLILLENK